MNTQVFVASTAFGLATLAAALADGLFADEGIDRSVRRVLIISTHAEMPEAVPSLLTVTGVAKLVEQFDAVYDYNELIEPLHPSGWRPREEDLPLWQRHLTDRWGLLGDVRLIVESIQVDPALALCRILAEARIDVYADGLMSYGPTRNPLPDSVGTRIERLLHLDLVPGVAPMLLTEWHVPPVVISTAAFRLAIAAMIDGDVANSARPVVLVLGQYLAAADLLTDAEETELYLEMIRASGQAGARRVVFKPHPSAPWTQHAELRRAAAAAGIDLEITADHALAESWFARGGVDLVVGCFSTALMTAATGYGLPVARLGTELMLNRLTPYQNSNRIPVTIVDALIPDLHEELRLAHDDHVALRWPAPPEPAPDIAELVVAVSYAMQPVRQAGRRREAVDFLTRFPASRARYVKRQRLTRLRLPGALPPRPRPSRVRRTLRRLNQLRGRSAADPADQSRTA